MRVCISINVYLFSNLFTTFLNTLLCVFLPYLLLLLQAVFPTVEFLLGAQVLAPKVVNDITTQFLEP